MFVFYRNLAFIVVLGVLLSCFIFFYLGNGIWQFFQLIAAFVGGSLTLGIVWGPTRSSKQAQPWSRKERLAWTLIGGGAIARSIGEAFWSYSLVMLHLSPFPSLADVGYFLFPPLVFLGLLCLPSSNERSNRTLILLDSFIALASLLGIGWYLLLASLTSALTGSPLANVLTLYYPICDIALFYCVIFLLLRTSGGFLQGKALRYGLFWLGIGVATCALSDFILHMQQSPGSYVDSIWRDLGWPLGLLIMGIAASLRRFLSASSAEQSVHQTQSDRPTLNYLAVYVLVGLLLLMLCLYIISATSAQIQQLLVFLACIAVTVGLMMVRQAVTTVKSTHILDYQADTAFLLKKLAETNNQIEERLRLNTQRSADLERGIMHLQEVLAELANGNLRARAHISSGELLSLASGLNLMAERLSHTKRVDNYLQRLTKTLNDFSIALEQSRSGQSLSLPDAYREFPEVRRLVLALGIKETALPPLTRRKTTRALPQRQSLPAKPHQDAAAPKGVSQS